MRLKKNVLLMGLLVCLVIPQKVSAASLTLDSSEAITSEIPNIQISKNEEGDISLAGTNAKSVAGTWRKSSNGKWWYQHPDGSYTVNNWEKISGKWYLFDANGWMLKGWQIRNKKWYYLGDDESGYMRMNWKKIGGE